MKQGNIRFQFLLALLIAGFSANTIANDATSDLFALMDKGGCSPSSLTTGTWTITSPPVGTHGELTWGDELVFEQLDASSSVSHRSNFNIWRNGALWTSDSGWSGSCVRDGTLSLYVVTGDVSIEGCLHELAIGRLDHDNNLGNRVEIVFEDKFDKKEENCTHFGDPSPLHPGHAHGEND